MILLRFDWFVREGQRARMFEWNVEKRIKKITSLILLAPLIFHVCKVSETFLSFCMIVCTLEALACVGG